MVRDPCWWPVFGVLSGVFFLSGCEEFGLPGSSPSQGAADAEKEPGGTGSRSGSVSDAYSAEPGSCNSWKISYCEAVEQCSAFSTHEECQVDVGYVRCAENAPFQSCQNRIDAALKEGKCEELPDNCNPAQIADRSVPTQVCEEIYQAICELSFFCGTELSIESCMASLQTSSPCARFTAVLPEAEQCVDALSVQACGDAFPTYCSGVLRY